MPIKVERLMARCDYCRKTIRVGKAISAPTGRLFDSLRCHALYLRNARLDALRNTMRVARSRLKARVVSKAETTYRGLGGRDWPKVEELLKALL